MTDQDTDFNDFFDEIELTYEQRVTLKAYNYFFTMERIVLTMKKTASILDVGCADGMFYQHLRDEQFTGIIDGVEISPKGRKEYYKRHPKDTVLFDSIDNIQGKYDIVTALQTLEHQAKPEELLKKMYDCAKHMVIFTVPNNDSIKSKTHRSVIGYYKVCEMCESLCAKDYHIYMINRDRKFAPDMTCLGVVILK